MAEKKIFHYTSIETLALILKSRKIRFNRLDRVDDVREAQIHGGINFGKYFFVSCWTLRKEESIPQWKMYSGDMRGVRLELPEYPFKEKVLRCDGHWHGIDVVGDVRCPLSQEEIFGPDYMIMPLFLGRNEFGRSVEYVQDVASEYANHIERREVNGSVSLKIKSLPRLPAIKSKDWEFQSEYRYALSIFPTLPYPETGPMTPGFADRYGEYISYAFINGIEPNLTYFDLDLDDLVFEQLVVRTAPLCTTGGKVTVEALLATFAPGARMEQSALEGQCH